jgi:pimeloyl-ACP methyl ester carboxylesterase
MNSSANLPDTQSFGSGPPSAVHPALSRRTLVGGAVVAGALLSARLGPPVAASEGDLSHRQGVGATAPRGRGSVSGAPHLPAGFERTFRSRYIDAGDVRLHAVTGGDGPPLLLVHGWPQTWYAWRLVMPALAQHHHVIAVDQRGIGLSDKPHDGYDSTTLVGDMVALMDALGHQRFSVYGTDVGMPIAYAVAADHRDRVDRLAVSEAFLPGLGDGPPLLQRIPIVNARLWHLAFNQLPAEVNEALVKGREDVFFGAEFDAAAGTNKLPDEVVRYYVRMLRSDRNALRGSFGFYRAWWSTADQNMDRFPDKLTVPVLAMGGEQSSRDTVGTIMMAVANDVQTLVIPDSGHWVAEEAPDQIVAALTAFLAG